MHRTPNWIKYFYLLCWGILLSALMLTFGVSGDVPVKDIFGSQFPLSLRFLLGAPMFLAVGGMLSLLLRTLPPSGKGFRIYFNVLVLVCQELAAVSLVSSCCFFLFSSAEDAGIFLMCLMAAGLLALALALNLTDSHNRHMLYMEKHKSFVLWNASALGFTIIGLTFWQPGMWGLVLPAVHIGDDLLGYYGAQLSLTFITISVMSVLSDKSVVVYWENIAEAKLIKPLFGSFASYTAYSITATVGGGISVLLGNHLAFAVFFGFNVLTLILLTLTMVDVYYGRDSKKKGLQRALQRTSAAYRQMEHLQNVPKDPDLGLSLLTSVSEYQDNMLRLQHQLHRAITDHDIPYINELLELYGKNMECFQFSEGRAVETLLLQSAENVWEPILLSLNQHVSELEDDQTFTNNPFRNDIWHADSLLWKTFAQSEPLQAYLQQLPPQSEIPSLLCFAVLHRMTVLINDMLMSLYGRFAYRRHQLSLSLRDGQLFVSIPPKALYNCFTVYADDLTAQGTLISALCRLIVMLLPYLSADMRLALERCPFLPLIGQCLPSDATELRQSWPFAAETASAKK